MLDAKNVFWGGNRVNKKSIMQRIEKTGLVPVVVIEDIDNAVPTARALLAGGIDMMEITFRTACAKEAIRKVNEEVPEMLVGAGTILDLLQVQEAISAGAEFIVSPGFSEEVVRWCEDAGIAVIPGCVTPTEIMGARRLGLSVVKYFPANLYGGIKGIKTLSGVFRDMRFLPTGGVNLDNLVEFAAEKSIIAIGGSFVCTSKDIQNEDFDKITDLCKKAVGTIREVRG